MEPDLEKLLHNVKLHIKVARQAAHTHLDGSAHEAGWITAIELADGTHQLTTAKPWMVGALTAAILQLSRVQQELSTQVLAKAIEQDVKLLDATEAQEETHLLPFTPKGGPPKGNPPETLN